MDLPTLNAFFGWCAVINAGLLILSTLILGLARGWVFRFHSRMFPMPEETFNAVIYGFLGLFKLGWIFLNLVPYLALRILVERAY